MQTDQQAAVNAGYTDLARAVVRTAIRDVLRGRDPLTQAEAAAWLAGPDGQEFAELAGFDTTLITRWVQAGCPRERVLQ